MAVRIQNTNEIDFGDVADAEVTITHGRVSVGTDVLATRALTTSRVIPVGEAMKFDATEVDLVVRSGEFENAGFEALLELAREGTNELTFDAMTSSTVVVSDSGYSQQTTAAFDFSTEAD